MDDFDGPTISPWGGISEGYNVEGHFSQSQLHITRVYFPGSPGSSYGSVGLARYLGGVVPDFRFTVRLGWDASEYSEIYMGFSHDPVIAGVVVGGHVAYKKRPGQAPIVQVRFSSLFLDFAAPEPGMHTFSIEYSQTIGREWVDGQLLFERQVALYGPVRDAGLMFAGPDSSLFAPLHVDWANFETVPEPGCVIPLTGGLILLAVRRRQR